MKTTDETTISCVNALASILSENYGNVNSTEYLEKTLLDIVGSPNGIVEIYSPVNSEIGSRVLPSILTGHSKCRIRIEKENGCVRWLRFPSCVGRLDRQLDKLREARTAEEIDLEEFKTWLLDQLDGYGHLNYTVGSENCLSCGDAVSSEFKGKRYVAHHVVFDCESGGFVETSEAEVTEVTPDRPPTGILSGFLDLAYDDTEDEIDLESCIDAIKRFDKHYAALWLCSDTDIIYDAD